MPKQRLEACVGGRIIGSLHPLLDRAHRWFIQPKCSTISRAKRRAYVATVWVGSAVAALGHRLRRPLPAQVVQMVVSDDQPAGLVLDAFELVAGIGAVLARIGHGIVDRRELDEVVLAFLRSIDNQQHKPDWLQFPPPKSTALARRRSEAPAAICHYSARLAIIPSQRLANGARATGYFFLSPCTAASVSPTCLLKSRSSWTMSIFPSLPMT